MTLVGLGLLAAGVFKLKSNDGLLVVQVNEPNADVFVDGDPMTATWTDDGRTTVIRVKPGDHQVEVKKSGFTNTGDEVTVAERRSIGDHGHAQAGDSETGRGTSGTSRGQPSTIELRTDSEPDEFAQHALDEATSAMKSVEAGR